MSREEVKEALENFREEASSIEVMRFLRDELVDEMNDFPVEDSDSNEHQLNMVIRGLEEDLDLIENRKLGDWDPESV
ncbi:hypothetical protein ACK3SF_01570 [Candidatus Nanosalina sp. VS9-1]|uniref:hypothetical protein n=1 Tax=Candidatus Nanosalina sp. VS9-1 TaxID=3388566 RepID=UPI0039E1423F